MIYSENSHNSQQSLSSFQEGQTRASSTIQCDPILFSQKSFFSQLRQDLKQIPTLTIVTRIFTHIILAYSLFSLVFLYNGQKITIHAYLANIRSVSEETKIFIVTSLLSLLFTSSFLLLFLQGVSIRQFQSTSYIVKKTIIGLLADIILFISTNVCVSQIYVYIMRVFNNNRQIVSSFFIMALCIIAGVLSIAESHHKYHKRIPHNTKTIKAVVLSVFVTLTAILISSLLLNVFFLQIN
ncbi:hypothetical protein NEFER03_0342 [Nematocida sp. LUAm3]|nr:hypothetical protein NEFER03_0342 [Nematocida sp. LUAm3]KAI5173794.1 hypothetical protein NEFER02_0310 [Nematocida sp. LUAm2]KAI5177017.1 hypothetical protein NEFER01_0342 [Nematocida sp. LUAm1]